MRIVFLVFGGLSYAIFIVTFLALIAFVGGFSILSHTVDAGGPATGPATAVVIDLALVLLFALQHSVMARPGFKAAWTRIVPPAIERSVYVLAASLALILLMVLWRPIPSVIWSVVYPPGAAILWALFALGWLIVLVSTFLISHFELFGLVQIWHNLRGRAAAAPMFRQPWFYRIVRHPLYSGFFLAFWSVPRMTAGHLLLATALSAFMIMAIRFEERDLVETFGDDYLRYRQTTGMLVPKMRRRPQGRLP